MRLALGLGTFAAVVGACGDASLPGNVHEWPTKEVDSAETPLGYGWQHAVTADNFDQAAGTKLGNASSTLAGQTLHTIVTDSNVRIRSDDQAAPLAMLGRRPPIVSPSAIA